MYCFQMLDTSGRLYPSSQSKISLTTAPTLVIYSPNYECTGRKLRFLVLRIYLSGHRCRVLSQRRLCRQLPSLRTSRPGACFVKEHRPCTGALPPSPQFSIPEESNDRRHEIGLDTAGSRACRQAGERNGTQATRDRGDRADGGGGYRQRPLQGSHGAGDGGRCRKSRADPGAVQNGFEGSEEGAVSRADAGGGRGQGGRSQGAGDRRAVQRGEQAAVAGDGPCGQGNGRERPARGGGKAGPQPARLPGQGRDGTGGG